jgi:organic hydroperoxide reductase OsmC/OhrA
MSSYVAAVEWTLDGEFARGRYSRAHRLRFDGGIEVAASASPSVVPRPWSVDAAVDPEELLVAAFVGPAPSAAELEALHHKAHDVCFIANSVKTEVRVAAANETPAAAL